MGAKGEPSAIIRPRLLGLLEGIAPRGVGLIVAPAGSGKSMLLSTWAAGRTESDVVHLTVEPSDNDAQLFGRRLLSALGDCIDVDAGTALLIDANGDALGALFVDSLVHLVGTHEGAVWIILDDVHLLGPALVDDLERLMTHLPRNARLILSSRTDPPLATLPLTLENRLTEIRGSDLAFDSTEGAELLRFVSRRELDPPLVEQLIDRTEGWAVGLQLAAVSMQRRDDLADFADRFSGSSRLVADYLTEEILDEVGTDLRGFLLRTSVLVELDVDLCDHVLQRSDSRSTIAELERRSILLTRDAVASRRVRYHQLFRDLLRYHLQDEHPDEIPTLHRRAADWHLRVGDAEAAVEHLLLAGENEQALATIRAHGARWVSDSRGATLVRWLRTIDRELGGHARIDLLAALTISGRHAEAADLFRELSVNETPLLGERVASRAIFSLLVRHDLPLSEAELSARTALGDLERVDDPSQLDFLGVGGHDTVEAFARYTLAWSAFLEGDLIASIDGFDALLERPGLRSTLWRISALGANALAHAWLGRMRDAERLALSSLELARETTPNPRTSTTHAHLALGSVMTGRCSDPTGAHEQFGRALDRAIQSRRARDRELHRLLLASLLANTSTPDDSMTTLQAPLPSGVATPLIRIGGVALEARLWLTLHEPRRAARVLEGIDPMMLPATHIDVLLAVGNGREARRVLDAWQVTEPEVRASVDRLLREALVLQAEGRAAAAERAILEAVGRAAPEQLRSPFVEAPGALPLLRTADRRINEPFVTSLLGSANADARQTANQMLDEHLTDRELAILQYLASRLDNSELAAELYISVNTLKTHLRSIYRKLGVPNRDAAVRRASEFGLL
ncbi:MAG: LuxR C-terminal-related transcriptional regulator [Ilumatobacteraceae bacterium]